MQGIAVDRHDVEAEVLRVQGLCHQVHVRSQLTWLAARTSSIRVAPAVLALPHRHPAVLAKMAETLDRLSDGRLVLVLGGGGPMNEPAYRAFGLAQRSLLEKVEALEEAIDILRGLWSTCQNDHIFASFDS